MSKTARQLKVTLVKSPFGRLKVHRDCVRGLGLRHLHHTVTLADSPEIRGMINKAAFLLQVEEN